MKYLLILGLFTQILFGQTLGKLYYDQSKPVHVAPPIQAYKEMMNKAEQQYYKNRNACNEIEIYIVEEQQKLKVDTLNIVFKNNLKENYIKIKKIQSEKDFGSKTMEIIEIVENLQKNQINYQDENEIIRLDLERKLKIQEEENKKLKLEIELKNSANLNLKKKSIKK